MPDWGLARGPTDTRSHAEMLMDGATNRQQNPHDPCDCGGTFTAVDDDITPRAIQKYSCTDCGDYTWDWTDSHKANYEIAEEYRWEEQHND